MSTATNGDKVNTAAVATTARSSAMTLAVPLLCDMASTSRKTREILEKHGALDTYVQLIAV